MDRLVNWQTSHLRLGKALTCCSVSLVITCISYLTCSSENRPLVALTVCSHHVLQGGGVCSGVGRGDNVLWLLAQGLYGIATL